MSSTLRTIITLGSLGFGAVWLVKQLTTDSLGRPISDSFGQRIDYAHNIAYIPDTKDPRIIQQARSSWELEERIKKANAARDGLPYTQTPFQLHKYYGGYRD